MAEPRDDGTGDTSKVLVDTGGPPCSEAQADGVPCDELGKDCEDCEKAQPEGGESER